MKTKTKRYVAKKSGGGGWLVVDQLVGIVRERVRDRRKCLTLVKNYNKEDEK